VDYTYNSFDLVVTRDDPRDVTTTYQYDGLNRIIGVGYSIAQGSSSTSMPNNCTPSGGNAAHVCFVYGTSATANNNGRLIQMIDGVGGEEYTYDALGRVTKVDKEIDSTIYSIEYAYNRVGAITSVEYPSGRTVAHSFDAIGRLTQVASGGTNYISNVAYNAAHAPTGYDYGNGVAASIGYNSRFQLASLAYAKSGTKLLELAYSYTGHSNGGNNGQITGITDSTGTQEAGRTVSYTYDGWARLKTAATTGSTTYPAWGLSWTYDRYGNRTEQIQTAGSPPAHDPAVDPETNRFTDSGYTYDDAGNMTADGLNTLAYDGESRVATSTTNSVTTTSTYDGNSLRVKKQVGSGTATIYIFSGSKVIAEYAAGAGTGSPTVEYIYAGGSLVASIDSSSTRYHHADHLSVRVTSNTSGTSIGEQGHYPFGESWYSTGTGSKFRFTSYERDQGSNESGNDYAVFRTYIGRLGRFNRPDPIAGSILDPQSLNRYAYVRSNPISNTDRLGLESYVACGGAECIIQDSSFGGGNCRMDGMVVPCGYANGFLAMGAAVPCPNNFCGPIWDRDKWWVFEATTGGSGAYYPMKGRPGTKFATNDEALAAGAEWAQAQSLDRGIEHCGMTYSKGGEFFLTVSAEGTYDSCQPLDARSAIPLGGLATGGYHGHGRYDPRYDNDMFSEPPGGDIGWSLLTGFPFSLGTPGGNVMIFYPDQYCQRFVFGGPEGTATTIPICQP
jgi:RHS repeat-associated protein